MSFAGKYRTASVAHFAEANPVSESWRGDAGCDNPPCVNPNHLETGTTKDNARDMVERGRNPDRQGEKHPLAKLTADKVLEIRRLAACGKTHVALSKQFGVRRGQIGKITQRINWRHI